MSQIKCIMEQILQCKLRYRVIFCRKKIKFVALPQLFLFKYFQPNNWFRIFLDKFLSTIVYALLLAIRRINELYEEKM